MIKTLVGAADPPPREVYAEIATLLRRSLSLSGALRKPARIGHTCTEEKP